MAVKLEINGISFSYGSRRALRDAILTIDGSEVVSLVGPNGSGKTTLLKCINRILKPKGGVVIVAGKDVSRIGLKEIARSVGYVPQSAAHSFPVSVFDTVLLGRRPYVSWGISPQDKEVVAEAIALMGLEEFALRQFNELSGGERQRVLIARALAQQPQVLLLDEPTSNLDIKHQLEVLQIVRMVATEREIAVVMAIHDLNMASRFSDTIVCLRRGEIYDIGSPADVITEETIRTVYEVEVAINGNSGRPHIVPLAPVAVAVN
ncbi:MAG: Fe(3+) dicitrate transport ATP-binding protein FecE [Dehalococcoidia bacterium]|nr:Fe(3+) dicitrate transport ATP-binding protein FecE [Bacillota bacterium]MBT9165974.1 Fe(3+) dicitrate transport ATP-binding protein FecE [Chloroflexota bacterium]